MRRPKIKNIECFIAVAEELNFRRAAEKLAMSQPPLSRHIKSLEEDLGVDLFYRDTHAVFLTKAGRIFEEDARRILDTLDAAMERVSDVGRSVRERLMIGMTNAVDSGLVPPIEPLLARDATNVTVILTYAISRHLSEQVRHGALDLAIVGAPSLQPPGLTTHPLFEDPMVAALPDGHPAAARGDRITFQDLSEDTLLWFRRADNPPFYDAAEALFDGNDYHPRRKPEPDDINVLLAGVAADDGVAFLPSSLTALRRRGVTYRRFTTDIESRFTVTLTLIRRANETRPLALQAWDRLITALRP